MGELGHYKASTKVSSCQQLTHSGFQVFPLKKKKKEKIIFILYQCPKKGAQNRALCHSTAKTKELFITWWILIQAVYREKEQLRIF